jgi:6-phosphogluconate dehydrogenase
MELGMVGLGRMGANMSERLVRAGHRIVSYDRDPEAVKRLVGKGAQVLIALSSLSTNWLPRELCG